MPTLIDKVKKKIVDTRPFLCTFTEDINPETKKKTFRVAGLFQKTDEKNENNRLYPDALWEKICKDPNVQERIRKRAMIGELEHPDDLQTKLPRVSHLIVKLEKRGNEIWGEAEILNTPSGLILQELFRANVQVGISSRGRGTSTWHNNVEVVNDDYILDTFDFVSNPATSGAYPKIVSESVQKDGNKESNSMKEIEEIQSRLDDIKLIVSKGLTESKKEKYQKDILSIQKELTKYLDNSETKIFAEELLDEAKELKKKLKEQYGDDDDKLKDKDEKYHKCPSSECPSGCPGKEKEKEEEEEEKDIEECFKCRTKLLLEVNSKVYYCGNCQFDLPVRKALSKTTLAEKYVNQVKINRTFLEQIKSFKEANRILSSRLDSAVKTVAALVNENKQLVVENYVLKLVERYPVLSKFKGQLLQCNSVQCVDKQIELLQPQLTESKQVQPVKTKPVFDTIKKQDNITSEPDKKMVTVNKKDVIGENKKNGIVTTTKSSSLAEQIYAKMQLF